MELFGCLGVSVHLPRRSRRKRGCCCKVVVTEERPGELLRWSVWAASLRLSVQSGSAGQLGARQHKSTCVLWLFVFRCSLFSEMKTSWLPDTGARSSALWVAQPAAQMSGEEKPLPSEEKHAVPETSKKLKTRSCLLVSHIIYTNFPTVHVHPKIPCRSTKLSDIPTSSDRGLRRNPSSPPVRRETRIETSTRRKVIFDLAQDPWFLHPQYVNLLGHFIPLHSYLLFLRQELFLAGEHFHLLVDPLHTPLWDQPHQLDGLFRKLRHVNCAEMSVVSSFKAVYFSKNFWFRFEAVPASQAGHAVSGGMVCCGLPLRDGWTSISCWRGPFPVLLSFGGAHLHS